MACGKKAGKTTTQVFKVLEVALSQPSHEDIEDGIKEGLPGGIINIGIISISYDQCDLVFKPVVNHIKSLGYELISSHERVNPKNFEFINWFGAVVRVRTFSTKEPDQLRGFKWSFVTIDEAAYMPFDIWDGYLGHNVRRSFIATSPNGKNWVYDFFLEGQKKDNPDFFSLQFDTFSNTRMPDSDYQRLLRRAEWCRTRAPLTYRQDYLGEFVAGNTGYFTDFEKNINYKLRWSEESGIIIQPQVGMHYCLGIDLARYQDFTVIDGFDIYRRHSYHKKFGHEPWSMQIKRIVEAARMYPGVLWIDQTGLGDPIVERLQSEYFLPANGVKFNYENKVSMLNELRMALSTDGAVELAPVPETLQALNSVVTSRSQAGRDIIGDASGHVPDEIVSLGLAMWGLKHVPLGMKESGYGTMEQPELDDFGRPISGKSNERLLWRPGHREPIKIKETSKDNGGELNTIESY